MMHDKLQAAHNLKKKEGWKGNPNCSLCGKKETINHIFFICPLVRFAWCSLRYVFKWDGFPISVSDLWENWIPGGFGVPQLLDTFMVAGLMWAIWRIRNTR
jgi:hypothetical protein